MSLRHAAMWDSSLFACLAANRATPKKCDVFYTYIFNMILVILYWALYCPCYRRFFTAGVYCNMFDVSWNDPSRETRGQRKTRKDSQANGPSRGSSVRSSGSSNSKASKSSGSASAVPRPAIFGGFGIFGGNKKTDLALTGSQSKLSPITPEERAVKRLSNYIPPHDIASYSRPGPANTIRRESTDTEEPSDG